MSDDPAVSTSSKRWEPPSPEELQALMPGYTIERLLGKGGMGAVYQGVQENLERPVAIKIISSALDEVDASYAQRFKNEAKAMAKLNHPGIVAVHDFGETSTRLLYIVMEYVEGTDVARMIVEQKRLHTEHAMAITAHVCDALAYAHERGIIHRDIKPANIMVGYDGVVKVADFGLAKMTKSGESGLTQSGMAMGTLHYMAPEALILGASVDHRADIYAVGVMLYQMLTGKVPHGMFELPSMQVPGLDPRYDAIIARAMREDRDIRYQHITELRHDLDSILTQPVVKVDPEAEKVPAALLTQARPQRPEGQPPFRPPPQSQIMMNPVRKSSVLPWLVTAFAVTGLTGWFYLNRSQPDATTNTVTESSTVKTKTTDADSPATPTPGVSLPSVATPNAAAAVVAAPLANMLPISAATKDKPFINSLGMKFVPVPVIGGRSDGKLVLFSIWETRVQDYEVFVKETKRTSLKPAFAQGPAQPAVNVNWGDAQAFCVWLTDREQRAGRLRADEQYRLPSDHEWSCAAGIDDRENAMQTPAEKNQKVADVFPWGASWPPPPGTGNFGGEETSDQKITQVQPLLAGYRDNFSATSPVGSFMANRFGLFDLDGNVREWCDDWFERDKRRLLRGGSWASGLRNHMLSSLRVPQDPDVGTGAIGFRCVIYASREGRGSAPAVPLMVTTPTIPELAALDGQFRKLQAERVTAVFDAEVAKLNSGYLGGLEREIAKERAAGRLDGVLALEDEKKRVIAKQPVPATDEPQISAVLKNLRVVYREEYAKIEATRAANLKLLTDPLIGRLKTLESDLTKQNRIADAKVVSDYSEVLSAQESTLAYNVSTPFINSLGMKFVYVPDTKVMFCIHETRRQDYAAYASANPGVNSGWRSSTSNGLPVGNKDDHPVAMISWEDANSFCDWLSRREGRVYRLPTDREWSFALGIGGDESAVATPKSLSEGIKDIYPWGTGWLPPKGMGNYSDASLKELADADIKTIEGYFDGYPTTAPVMSFAPNKLGICDLGGNMWEWCADWYDEEQGKKVMRGGSWLSQAPNMLLSSHRRMYGPSARYMDFGFRCVLEARSIAGGSTAAATSPLTPSASNTSATVAPAAMTPVPTSAPLVPSKPANPKVVFTNTLGMQFVPLPGLKVQMCVHETRKGDYAAFAAAVPSLSAAWKNVRGENGVLVSEKDDHPVVNVSWEEAAAFCTWLSQKEGRTYRLPTDREWSIAVGIGAREPASGTPESLTEKLKDVYPWGASWPPTQRAGNYSDTVAAARSPGRKFIPGFTDGHATTAPVMSFPASALGIHDLGGNVWEFCSDWFNTSQQARVLRGGSWGDDEKHYLLSSSRDPFAPTGRFNIVGFRVVLETP